MKRFFTLLIITLAFAFSNSGWAKAKAVCGCTNAAGQLLAVGWDTVQVPGVGGALANSVDFEIYWAVRNATNFYNNWLVTHPALLAACPTIVNQVQQVVGCVYLWQVN